MPYVSIDGVPKERLSFLGFERMHETPEFVIYRDLEGRISIADKQNPYIWVDDISDAIQVGGPSIVTRPT